MNMMKTPSSVHEKAALETLRVSLRPYIGEAAERWKEVD